MIAAGTYAGIFWSERQSTRKNLNDSLLQIALNLESIRNLHDGKTSEAISLINANIDMKLVYLMRYDSQESEDSDFVRRRKRVMSALAKEWADHPRMPDSMDSPSYSDPEWQQYQNEVANYLKQSAGNE